MSIVILTEKPSAARNFAKALGGNSGTFDGEDYKIVHSAGHLYEFPKEVEKLTKGKEDFYKVWAWKNLPWDPADFNWNKRMIRGSGGLVKDIRAGLKGATEVVIATDVDPSGEGELLAWEILDDIGWKGKTTRMYFTDEAEKSIRKAFKTRKVIKSMLEDGDYVKADTRSRFDYLSMQLTRAATLVAREKGCGNILRQGRLKSVMVYLVGKQLELCKNYKRTPFYTARYRDENGHIYKRKEANEERFSEKSKVSLKPFKDSSVTLDSKSVKYTAPPVLLDLAALSSILARKGIKAQRVLAVYQKMYEDHIVSYPRTEDKNVTPEQFAELLPLTDSIAKVVGVDPKLLTHRTARKTHVMAKGSHGANRPGINVPKSLSELSKYGPEAATIYEVIAKNWLAMLAEDYEYEHQTGHVTDHPEFVGTANIPLKPGYKAVYDADSESKDKKEDDTEKDGGEGKPLGKKAKAFVHEGANPKPQRPTQNWLIGKNGQLTKYNVGTGATRTSTLAEITDGSPSKKKVQLMTEKRGVLDLTDIGWLSYKLLEGCMIASPKITETLFNQMEEVGKFKLDPEKVVNEITKIVIHDMAKMRDNAATIKKGDGMAYGEKEKVTGLWNGEEVQFNREWSGHRFTDDEIESLLDGETITIEAVSAKTGKNFKCTGHFAEQVMPAKKKGEKDIHFFGFKFDEFVQDANADDDKVSGVFEPTGETIRFKKVWGGHTFTDAEVEKLLAGDTIEFSAVSSRGKDYTARGKLEEQEYKGHPFWGFKADFGR